MEKEKLPKPVQEALDVLFVEQPIWHKVITLHLQGVPIKEIAIDIGYHFNSLYAILASAKEFIKGYIRDTYHSPVQDYDVD